MLNLKKLPVDQYKANDRKRYLRDIKEGHPRTTYLAHSPKAFSYEKGESNRIFLGWEWEVMLHDSGTLAYKRAPKVRDFGEDIINEYASPHVDSGDLEITSIPATLEYHRRLFKETILKTKNFYPSVVKGSGDTTKNWIGIHIHIDRRAFTPNSLRKFVAFTANPTNFGFIEEIAQRSYKPPRCNFEYDNDGRIKDILVTKPLKKESISAFRHRVKNTPAPIHDKKNPAYGSTRIAYGQQESIGADRNSSISIGDTRHPTVEVRMFKSVSSPELFFKNLEFCDALVRYCRVSSISNLYAKDFVNWVNEEKRKDSYRNLLSFSACQRMLKH